MLSKNVECEHKYNRMDWKHPILRDGLMLLLYWVGIWVISSFIVQHFTTDVVWGEGKLMPMIVAGSIGLGTTSYINGWLQENRHAAIWDATSRLKTSATKSSTLIK